MSTENLCSVTEQATVQAMVESINNGMTPQGSTTPDSNCSAKEKEQSAQLLANSVQIDGEALKAKLLIKLSHHSNNTPTPISPGPVWIAIVAVICLSTTTSHCGNISFIRALIMSRYLVPSPFIIARYAFLSPM